MTDFSGHTPLRFTPAFKERVWGGKTLGQPSTAPIGEAWILHEDQPVEGGPLAGVTLAELTRQYPRELLGAAWRQQHPQGGRFPLLVKLLDCQDWLSVQVHPNDEQARRMVGPGELGKTEAWHVLQADEGAELISGTREGTTQDELEKAILAGNVSDLTEKRQVKAGETLMVPAGTLHALGPGLLIYEVQQTSDTTYRVYDWDRPADAGRQLHLKQSAEVTRPGQAGFTPADAAESPRLLTSCDYFVLEELRGPQVWGDTDARTPHILTVKQGEAHLNTPAGTEVLKLHDTVLIPAQLGEYELTGEFQALRARLP
ncbi:type I phosphomannose isomerase catalytic subunit [Deinococcus antarcticus]|uniref:Type I phosphomannose isomerase catalytic subunit n=1 Tax=Deinococcus antarcticus TaxID=1298767 RepID=A0ABV8ACA9_9DEIO